jgi:hypothetical protein
MWDVAWAADPAVHLITARAAALRNPERGCGGQRDSYPFIGAKACERANRRQRAAEGNNGLHRRGWPKPRQGKNKAERNYAKKNNWQREAVECAGPQGAVSVGGAWETQEPKGGRLGATISDRGWYFGTDDGGAADTDTFHFLISYIIPCVASLRRFQCGI